MKLSNFARRRLLCFLFVTVLFPALSIHAEDAGSEAPLDPPIAKEDVVIVVDKKENKIHVAEYDKGGYNPKVTYDATLGLVAGDKMIEGDKKTPEGVYDFLFRALPPSLKPKFGVMALYVDYPNFFDKASGKTGFDILLHGTNDPSRLERKFDSLGCVVVDNSYLENIWKYVTLKQTKIIITRDFSKINRPARLPRLESFIASWLKAWSSKDIDAYISSYAYEFENEGRRLIQYKKYKDALNKKYETITVTADNIRYYMHEKYDVVTFDQTYMSTFPGGQTAFEVKGKKILYLQERNGRYHIIREDLQRS